MPIYEYECKACGKPFEHLQRRADDKPSQCPACGGKKLAKVLSGFSVKMAAPKAHQPSPAKCAGCPSGGCPYSGR